MVARSSLLKLLVLVFVIIVLAYSILTFTRRVDGISMYPTLREGDVVIIEPARISSISVNDIIVYGPPCSAAGQEIIHRVVQITRQGLITQGDNRRTNPYSDQTLGISISPITQDCLVGKVVFVIPYLDIISTLPGGLSYIIAGIIIVFVIISEFSQTEKEKVKNSTGLNSIYML